MRPRASVHTLGCKLNYAESAAIGRQFIDRGFDVVPAGEPAEVFVLNTCSVTERANRECRQIIRRVLREAPGTYVVVTGCYAQLKPGEIRAIDGVDLIVGAHEKFRIIDRAGRFHKTGTPDVHVSCIDETPGFEPASSSLPPGMEERTRAYLKIQDGCDFVCSFCTIPLARGASRSALPEDILGRAADLAALGYREVVLTGVNVGDYRTPGGEPLEALVGLLESAGGIDRFRISSVEPNLFTPGLHAAIRRSEKFCNHFHIPLQSGSDRVLGLMRRRYKRSEFAAVVDRIKSADPDAGIGADVIVGFPGETEALFAETYRFIEALPLTYLHVFTYSERENTPAASYPDRVEPGLRYRRSELLRELGRLKKRAFHSSLIGKTLPVLFESGRQAAGGLSPNYARVSATASVACAAGAGTIAAVRIDQAEDDRCTGTIL